LCHLRGLGHWKMWGQAWVGTRPRQGRRGPGAAIYRQLGAQCPVWLVSSSRRRSSRGCMQQELLTLWSSCCCSRLV
jgi:hypothetical protein